MPLGNRLLRWKTNPPSGTADAQRDKLNRLVSLVNSDLLYLQFAGIIITKSELSHQWFKGNLINQFVQFKLLHNEGDAIKCIIYAKRKVKRSDFSYASILRMSNIPIYPFL